MADTTPLERRIVEIGALFDDAPPRPEALFAPSFLAQVPPDQVRALVAQLRDRLGALSTAVMEEELGPGHARYRFTFANGYAMPVTAQVASSAPHLVEGLLFGTPVRLAATLDDVVSELRALPGQVSFLLARVVPAPGGELPGLEVLAAVEPGRTLAVASACKLWVLAELVRAVENRERRWDDVVRTDAADCSLPSGTLHTWPVGSPITLHTAATLMISVSDNTAADLLLRVLGDERVEAVQRRTGHASPERNVPFLATREMFALTSAAGAPLAARWVATTEAARRRALAAEAAALPYESLYPPAITGRPGDIARLEWFASARDLAHVMAWLRDHTDDARTAPARALLAVNPGLQVSRTHWPYVGFKGGGEEGVMSLGFLLRGADARWYTLAAIWNDPVRAVDANALLPLVQRALELVGQPGPA